MQNGISASSVSASTRFNLSTRILLGLTCLTVMSGCSTYFNPTVGLLAPESVQEKPTKGMPGLSEVVGETDKKIQLLEEKRNSSLTTNRALGVTTFGLGLGSAAYGLYGSHAHAMKNLAMAAGATYIGSSLFAPLAQTEIYQAGIEALSCINGKARRTRNQVNEITQDLTDAPPLTSQDFPKCVPDQTKLNRQKVAYEKAQLLAKTAAAKDRSLAGVARNASNNVLQELDKQLIGLTPSPDAILNAAKTLIPAGGISVSGESTSSTGTTNANPLTGITLMRQKIAGILDIPEIPPCDDQENSRLVDHETNYQAIAKSLTEAMNYMDDLSSACTLSAKTTAALSLSQEEITLTKDTKFINVVINGGREPYLLSQPQDIPGIYANLIQPRTINIVPDAAKIKAGEYKIEIRDSSTATITKILKITVTK